MDKITRYSDEIPYDKRRFWYFTTHGLGPGTLPKDLHVLDTVEGTNDKGTLGLYICLDGILNTSELKTYDLRELSPDNETSEDVYICEYLHKNKLFISDVWEENDEIHIYIEDGDWKHEHAYCKYLMEKLGYEQIREIDEPSDCDSYTAEHIYKKG